METAALCHFYQNEKNQYLFEAGKCIIRNHKNHSTIIQKEVYIMQKILVCDDDRQIVEAIDIYLTGEGLR